MSDSSLLFSPLNLRSLTLRNRVVVSPMCQYSSDDGHANDWHLIHLGSRAVGGAALVFTEATAVEASGRISPQDLGIWKDEHVPMLRRIAQAVRDQGAIPGMQLAHAGRKASTARPWEGGKPLAVKDGGWEPIFAPSAISFSHSAQIPQALDAEGISRIRRAFVDAAKRALSAGFQVLELHAAHGYLLHEFLSPLANQRADQYGGSLENRMRFLRELVADIRGVWPAELPLLVRISASDWQEGGWDIAQSIELAKVLREGGVDLIDCSSGGVVPGVKIPVGPGYQTPFAERIRRESGIATGAVGVLRSAFQAEHVVRTGQADVVIMARELLRDPYWPLRAARKLGAEITWPPQYERAKE